VSFDFVGVLVEVSAKRGLTGLWRRLRKGRCRFRKGAGSCILGTFPTGRIHNVHHTFSPTSDFKELTFTGHLILTYLCFNALNAVSTPEFLVYLLTKGPFIHRHSHPQSQWSRCDSNCCKNGCFFCKLHWCATRRNYAFKQLIIQERPRVGRVWLARLSYPSSPMDILLIIGLSIHRSGEENFVLKDIPKNI
jgi:hypothetical protein